MAVNPNLPAGVPPALVRSMAQQVLPAPGPGPMPALPPGGPPGPQQQSPQPQPPPGRPALQGPPPGAPGPGQGPPGELPPQILDALQTILKDPKARDQVKEIIKQLGGDAAQENPLDVLDPQTKMMLGQAWNSRKKSVAYELTAQRGLNPGASRAGDESLLTIWFTTPLDPSYPEDDPHCLPLSDIEAYADAVRLDLIAKQGLTDVDKIEDQTMRECFPLRESLIKTGRPFWTDQVEFATEMVKLAARWHDEQGDLPQPDPAVLKATKEGKGDPEAQPRDTDSEAFPAGEGYASAVMSG